MKRTFILIILIEILIYSCVEIDDNRGYEKVLKFHEKYSDEFLNSELNKFNFHIRTMYDYKVHDSISFRVLMRENVELLIINPYGFIETFNLPVDTNYIYDRAFFKKEDSLYLFRIENYNLKRYNVSKESVEKKIRTKIEYKFPIESIKNNPIEYFSELDTLRKKFGIFKFKESSNKVLTIYFSRFDYLMYIPKNIQFEENNKDYWDKKLRAGKRLDDNWYYYKSKKPLE
ncbi:MAG: hypothetical protein JEY97_10115 [Bacteroidales bacterium]|nr:hypothetical protein [Bacteroidales bacterium]